MSRNVIAVLVGTLLAMVVATVWVPVKNIHYFRSRWQSAGGGFSEESFVTEMVEVDRWLHRYCFAWQLESRSFPPPHEDEFRAKDRIVWPIVFMEQALILLLAGGMLTWTVRRNRRRRAVTDPV